MGNLSVNQNEYIYPGSVKFSHKLTIYICF